MEINVVDFQYIQVETGEGIAVLTVNRPKALNALNFTMLADLDRAVTDLARDDSIRAVIVTGSGEKAFVAGADVAEMQRMSAAEAKAFSKYGQDVFGRIETMPQPVIAAVNGFALGGGCELAMACDIRIAAENARFGQPETSLGITPGFGGTQRLPQIIGQGRAAELLFTAETIDAAEALRIGLVNKVVAVNQARDAAVAMARKIASRSPVAVRYCKFALAAGQNLGLEADIDGEAGIFALCFVAPDQKEGMKAFAEKRTPVFGQV